MSSYEHNNDASKRTHVDMTAARATGKLDVKAVRAFLHGSESSWKRRQDVRETLVKEPVFDKSNRHYATRKELYLRALTMQKRIEELREDKGWDDKDMSFVSLALDEPLPMHLHSSAFEPVFFSQGSQELKARYGSLVRARGILGCYLQTELGHGSAVVSLETTATYLPSSDEFELHSPSLTSAKWWIGALGRTSTHGVVQARLIIPGGADMGPHLFFVQLRDMETHRPLPNIEIGDIGPKAMAGYAGVDNGYARFNHVRIPRWHMLSKFAQVTREGKFLKPPHAKMSYGGMLYIRSGLITSAGRLTSKAATIAIRYATVRRQGLKGDDGRERQVISYPSVHHRLLPMVARAYVYILLGRSLMQSFASMAKELSTGDTSALPEMHAILSGLKAMVTSTSVSDVETARRSMGGHGYSAYAGLGLAYANYVPSTTYEGDNFVLDQQVVRAALKAYGQRQTVAMTPFFNFLRLVKHRGSRSNKGQLLQPDWSDWHSAVSALEWRAAKIVEHRAEAEAKNGVDSSSDQRVARAVTEAYIANQVAGFIESLSKFFSGETERILRLLFEMYLFTLLENALEDMLSYGILSHRSSKKLNFNSPSHALRLKLSELYKSLLPEAISLTDSFGYSDWELDSALGVYDGRVYEELWRRVQTEPLNQSEVTEGYEESIKPLLDRGKVLADARIRSKL